jgi:hypothetical protein
MWHGHMANRVANLDFIPLCSWARDFLRHNYGLYGVCILVSGIWAFSDSFALVFFIIITDFPSEYGFSSSVRCVRLEKTNSLASLRGHT